MSGLQASPPKLSSFRPERPKGAESRNPQLRPARAYLRSSAKGGEWALASTGEADRFVVWRSQRSWGPAYVLRALTLTFEGLDLVRINARRFALDVLTVCENPKALVSLSPPKLTDVGASPSANDYFGQTRRDHVSCVTEGIGRQVIGRRSSRGTGFHPERRSAERAAA